MSHTHKSHKNQSPHDDDHVFVKKHLTESKSIIQERKEVEDVDKDEDEGVSKDSLAIKSAHNLTRSARSRDEISENLAVIYQNQDGSLPNMKNFQRRKRSQVLRVFFSLLVFGVCSVALAFGILYFWQTKSTATNEVVLVVSSVQQQVKIGDSVTFQVRYRNPQAVSIAQASLRVTYPQGFVFEKSTLPPTNNTKDEWRLGSLSALQEGMIEITGKVFGSLGEQQSLRAFLNYLPANFSSEFQKVATYTVSLQSSPVSLVVKGPSETSYGATIPFEITVLKDKNFRVGGLSLVVQPPVGFNKKNSDPLSDQVSDFLWTLSPDATTTSIKMQGTFLSSDVLTTSTSAMVVKVLGYKTVQKTGDPVVLSEFVYTPTLFHTALEVKVSINGAVTEANVIPGENLNASFVLKNTGQTALKNIQLAAVFTAPAYKKQSILNWKEIQDPEDGVITAQPIGDEKREGKITWTASQIPDLASLAPGKEIRVDILLPIKKNSDEADKYRVWNIEVGSEAHYEVEGEKKVINGNPVSLMINSDLGLEVRNEISGAQNDVHTITWLLNNTYHPLKDIELLADVFGDTEFDQSKAIIPAGTLRYDVTKKQIRWFIPSLPLDTDSAALQFILKVNKENPTQTQLTSKVRVKAIDTITQEEIILVGDEALLHSPQEFKLEQ